MNSLTTYMIWPLILVGSWLGLALPISAATLPVQVGVSVPPVAYLVKQIGGGAVKVDTTIKPGQSPATYEVSFQQLRNLAQTQVYFRVGVPFEERFLGKLTQLYPKLKVVDLRQGIHLRKLDAHHHHGTDQHVPHSDLDPHIWTAPLNMITMGQTVSKELTSLLPGSAKMFRDNFKALSQELNQLHEQTKLRLKGFFGSSFYVFHPSWGYFAESYGLRQIAIEVDGKEPSPQDLARIIREAKTHKIKTILVQEQFSKKAAKTIARQVGAQVKAIDPLTTDYQQSILGLVAVLEGALQK